MNYLAHGFRFLDRPYFMAGTAVPDWLCVVDRRVRVRSKQAAPLFEHPDAAMAEVARGIAQHHFDDGWFHETRAFHELSLELTRRVREALPNDEGFRPSFLGHILVELLLDAELAADQPQRLDDYYRALSQVEPERVAAAVNAIASRPAERLAEMIVLFCRERFLCDYADDAKLWYRLNQVMRRVGLPLLPDEFRDILPSARELVRERKRELLDGPEGPSYD